MGILSDHDPTETQEWLDSLRAVLQYAGPDRAKYLLGKLREEALLTGAMPPFLATTPYRNTIPPDQEAKSPGELEHKIRSAIRWNAVAIILRANKESSELGGHIASFQSSAPCALRARRDSSYPPTLRTASLRNTAALPQPTQLFLSRPM